MDTNPIDKPLTSGLPIIPGPDVSVSAFFVTASFLITGSAAIRKHPTRSRSPQKRVRLQLWGR
jgi:hypothetical protein